MSDLFGFVLKTLKPFFGETRITVDREKKIVKITSLGRAKELTYDEVIDEIERIFGE